MGQRDPIADRALASGERPVYLVTLTLRDGRTVRAATRAISVAATLGGPYHYHPTLSGIDEFVEELDVFALDGIGALTQAKVEIVTTDDLAGLQADWHHVAIASAEVAVIWSGQTWEQRVVLLGGGVVQSLEIGAVGEPTGFVIETVAPTASETIGDDDRDISDEWSWSSGRISINTTEITDLTGSKFVHVFGDPESVPAYKIGGMFGNNRIIICGHRLPNTGTVRVYEDGVELASSPYTPVNDTGTTGAYAYIDDAGGAREFEGDRGAFTVSFDRGGIARADDARQPAIGAGAIARRLLRDSGVRVDWRACRRALAMMNEWRLGLYLDTEASALDVLRTYVLAYLPVVEMQSADGLYLAYVSPHSDPSSGDLVVGQNLVGRIGGLAFSDFDAIRNSFTISYKREEFAQSYTESLTVDATTSALCSLSRHLLRDDPRGDTGVREDDAIECPSVWDASTARRVLLARASRLALPRRVVTYQAAPDAYTIDVGGVYRLTDPELGIANVRGVVTSINRSLSPFDVTLELLDRTPVSR